MARRKTTVESEEYRSTGYSVERARKFEMGKRKTGKNVKENPAIPAKKRKGDPRCENEGGSEGFFGCYLLTSLSPRFKGFTYIGFTVNPRRRIRQHNGEITSGALRTKRKRPWEMVLCIYGFPTQVAALQFEWAWQHPRESLAVREAVGSLKRLGGLGSKIKLAYTMLTLPAWQGLNLTINFFSTKYMKHAAGCPNLPEQMKVRVCSMDDLPCYSGIDWDSFGHDDDDDDDDVHDDDAHGDGIEEEGSEEFTCSQNSSASEDSNRRLQPEFISPFLIRGNNVADGEEDELILVETNKLPETTVTVNQHPCLVTDNRTRDVEIIDICTPPPMRSANNMRRLSAVCPEIIIDLTESPILV